MQGVKAYSSPLSSRIISQFETDISVHKFVDRHTDEQANDHCQYIPYCQIAKHISQYSSLALSSIDSYLLFR